MADVAKELAALQRMSVSALRARYAEVFGETTTTGNRTWLLRRIAWRIQANAEDDLSERARARATELDFGGFIEGAPVRSHGHSRSKRRRSGSVGRSTPSAIADGRWGSLGSRRADPFRRWRTSAGRWGLWPGAAAVRRGRRGSWRWWVP
jgi:hypothetical protein